MCLNRYCHLGNSNRKVGSSESGRPPPMASSVMVLPEMSKPAEVSATGLGPRDVCYGASALLCTREIRQLTRGIRGSESAGCVAQGKTQVAHSLARTSDPVHPRREASLVSVTEIEPALVVKAALAETALSPVPLAPVKVISVAAAG